MRLAREVAQLRAAASELQREVLALSPPLDERDRVIRFAQIVLACRYDRRSNRGCAKGASERWCAVRARV
jgi:hypothetical protein